MGGCHGWGGSGPHGVGSHVAVGAIVLRCFLFVLSLFSQVGAVSGMSSVRYVWFPHPMGVGVVKGAVDDVVGGLEPV